MNKTFTQTNEIDFSNINMAIYWSALKELDVYSKNVVKTVSGDNAKRLIQILTSNRINVEVME